MATIKKIKTVSSINKASKKAPSNTRNINSSKKKTTSNNKIHSNTKLSKTTRENKNSNILNQIIEGSTQIIKTKMKPGQVVRFIYSGIKITDRNPLVLVLNPYWHGKTHALVLRNLSVRQVQLLMQIVQKNLFLKIADKLKKIINTNHVSVGIDNPRSFYYSKIKPFIRATGANIYRTYFFSKISNVQLITTKLDKKFWKDYAIQKQKVAMGFKRLSDKQYDKKLSRGDATQSFRQKNLSKQNSMLQNIKFLKKNGWL